MKKSLLFVTCLLLLIPVLFLTAASNDADDTNGDGRPDQWISVDEEGITIVENDRNYDGSIDYTLELDESGQKKREEMDFNYDGSMDDFSYYKNGVLVRREIDSNYDTAIDIWVYIHEGVYIKKYKRDIDFDGKVDVMRNFGEEEKEAEPE